MAEQRNKKQLKKKENVSDAGDFSKLPFDIQKVLLNKFHTIYLLTLRTNRFLYQLINNFILGWETSKFTLTTIFRSKAEKAKAAKKRFTALIEKSEQRISLTGAKLKGIAPKDLPPNLDLKGADSLEALFCPVEKTDLLNRIEMAEMAIQLSTIDLATVQYDRFGKDLGVNREQFDFIEHFILYHFSDFPIHPELKKKLNFKHLYHVTNKGGDTLPSDLRTYFPANNNPACQIYLNLPLWVSCPKECSDEEKEAFRAWREEIRQSIVTDPKRVIFFGTDTTEEGAERFMFVLDGNYAHDLLRNNPFTTALKFRHQIPWFLYDDTKETCKLLMREIEKFRGFAHGIPDQKIDEIKGLLKNIHDCADEVRKDFKEIEQWVKANEKDGVINRSLLEAQIDQRKLAILKDQLLHHFHKIIEENKKDGVINRSLLVTSKSVSNAGDFLFRLPSDIHRTVLNKLHTIHLLTFLRTNRFFYNLIHHFILVLETPKLTLATLFRSKSKKAKAAKKRFSELIVKAEQRISLAGANLKEIDPEDLPPNLDLKGADSLGAPFCPVKKTDLLNRIEMAIQISTIDLRMIRYDDQFGKKLDVNTQNFDFVEHFILYHFSEFPIQPDLKKKLNFKHLNHVTRINAHTLPSNLHGLFPINPGGCKIYTRLPVWVSCPKECSNEEKEAFRAWIEKIRRSVVRKFDRVMFFGTDTTEEGVERFMFVLDGNYAHDLLHNNPFATALRLRDEIPWFLYDDTKETCQLLMREIEKFRGFARGIPDQKIDEVKKILKDIHDCADTVREEFKEIEQWVKKNKKDRVINLSLLEKQIDQKKLAIWKPQLLRHFLHSNALKTIQEALIAKTIEEALIANLNDKPHCLGVFQQELTKLLPLFQYDLTTSLLDTRQIIRLFEAFKNVEILNRHRNPNLDAFFGIKNTESFKKAWKAIRDNAKKTLFSEVDA